ncbi:MAG: helix-turn-helix domain-containing protein [Bacteroidales bacterium]|nr:helix-turn-helix domain-containing protein [Bacteroidales bacterium]
MKLEKALLTILATTLVFCLAHTHAHAHNMRKYDVSSGLSTNSIKGIIQDELGHIWFASTDGLNCFNGKEFKSYGCSYRNSDKDGINALNVLTLLMHRDGRKLWAATQSSSLMLFDPDSEAFREIDLREYCGQHLAPNLCYALAYDRHGRLWTGTDAGIFIYDETGDNVTIYSKDNSTIPTDNIQQVFCDSNGTMWIGCDKGLFKYSQSTGRFTRIKTDKASFSQKEDIHISTINEASGGNLWIGTWNDGLAIFDHSSNTLKSLKPSADKGISSNIRIRSILQVANERLWICSNKGLFKYDIISNRLSQITLSTIHPNDNIYSGLIDREGGIWIGTFFQGVYYLSPRAKQIECYTAQNVSKGLNGSAISSFCEDHDGKMFIASENGGLSVFNHETKEFSCPTVSVRGDNIHALCISGKTLFMGTYSQGLKIADLSSGRIRVMTKTSNPELKSNNIFSLYKSSGSDIFIGTDQGCCTYDLRTGKISPIEHLDGSFIYDIKEDSHDNIWFACYYTGVFRYNRTTGQWKHYTHDGSDPSSLPNDKALSIYVDDMSALWICTEGGGVCRYCPESDGFSPLRLTTGNGPVNLSIVYGVLNDAEGRLWLTSNNGIWVCSPNGEIIRHLTGEDGLQSNQFNFGASYRSSSGKLYLGGVNGFNVISPENIRDADVPPIVTAGISYRYANKEFTFPSTSSHSGEMTLQRKISSFTVRFECLSFVAPHKNQFAYKIDDSEEWTYTAESSVTLLNFPYGKHTIKVRAMNSDGVWSDNEVALHINNLAPVLRSRTAIIIYILLFIAALTAVIIITERTPIQIVFKQRKSEESRENILKIEKNTRRLLNIVNQLVDDKDVGKEITSKNQEWFNHLTRIIQENIQEAEISVEDIAAQLNMSRSSFQRKLKALTGMSPVEFIRITRLKRAAELLSSGNYRINEVSYMVGFNKPSYFSALFKRQFGTLPKDYINKDKP